MHSNHLVDRKTLVFCMTQFKLKAVTLAILIGSVFLNTPTAAAGKFAESFGFYREPQSTQISELIRSYGFTHLQHVTPCSNIHSIIKSQKLLSSQFTKKWNYKKVVTQPHSHVFLSLVKENAKPSGMCALYFNLNLLDERQDYHLSYGWPFGKYVWHWNDYIYGPQGKGSAKPNELHRFTTILEQISVLEVDNELSSDHSRGTNEVVFKTEVDLNHLAMIELGHAWSFKYNSEQMQNLIKYLKEAHLPVEIFN